MSSCIRRLACRGNSKPRRKTVQNDRGSLTRNQPTRAGDLIVHVRTTVPTSAVLIRLMVASIVIVLAPVVVRRSMIVRDFMHTGRTIVLIVIVQRMNVHKHARKCPRRCCHSDADGGHHRKNRAHSPHEHYVAKPFDSTRQQH